MLVEDLWQIPVSRELATTLTRAIETVQSQQNPEITLEHLLLSLIDDHDAKEMLELSQVDSQSLIADTLDYTNRLQRADHANTSNQLGVCNNFKRVLESAASAARQGGRNEINGAIVLAAIVGDGKSIASDLLRAKGLTFEEAIRAIQRALIPLPSASVSSVTNEESPSTLSPVSYEKSSDSPRDQESQQPQPSLVRDARPLADVVTSEPLPQPRIFQEQETRAAQPAGLTLVNEVRQSAPPRPAPPNGKPPTKGKFSARPPQASSAKYKQQQGSAALFTMPAERGPNGPSAPPIKSQRQKNEELQRQSREALPPSAVKAQKSSLPNRAEQNRLSSEKAEVVGREAQGAPSPRPKGFAPKGTVRVAASQLAVNLPRRMRVLRPVLVEARVPRSDIKAISEGLQDGGAVYRHEIAITKAISVRLRAPQGGFWIENASPETQWVENLLGVVSDDFIRWRWTVTPKSRGRKSLQILMSARTVGTDGVAAETALPDQNLSVKVRPNFGKVFLKIFNWFVLLCLIGLAMRHWGSMEEKMSTLMKLMVPNGP